VGDAEFMIPLVADYSSCRRPPTNNQPYRWLAPRRLCVCRLVARPRGSNSLPSPLPFASGLQYTYALSLNLCLDCIPTAFADTRRYENPMAVGFSVPPLNPSPTRDPPVPKVDRAPDQEAALSAPRPRDRPRIQEGPTVPILCS